MGTRAEAKTHPKNSWHLTQSCGCAASTAFSWLPEWSVIVLGSCLERVDSYLAFRGFVRSFACVFGRPPGRVGFVSRRPKDRRAERLRLSKVPAWAPTGYATSCSFASAQNLLTGVCYVRSPPSHQHHHHLVLISIVSSTPTRGEFNGIAQNFVEFAFFPDFISGRTSAWKRSKLNDG